nr:MAG TPA: hypothetical protein [Crassvirales sp.]
MKKNTFALNIGEEALIEGFGIIKCIDYKDDCTKCCLYNNYCKGVEYNNFKSIPCYDSLRKQFNLDGKNVIFTRVTAVVKLKDIEL